MSVQGRKVQKRPPRRGGAGLYHSFGPLYGAT